MQKPQITKQLHMLWVNAFKSGSRVWVSAKILDQLLYQNYAAVMEPALLCCNYFGLQLAVPSIFLLK